MPHAGAGAGRGGGGGAGAGAGSYFRNVISRGIGALCDSSIAVV